MIADLERAPHRSWQEARRQLRALFERGHPPASPLDGEYAGRLLLVTVPGPLGAIARAWTSAWMPWKGKRFHAEAGRGENRFTDDARPLMWLCWLFDHRRGSVALRRHLAHRGLLRAGANATGLISRVVWSAAPRKGVSA